MSRGRARTTISFNPLDDIETPDTSTDMTPVLLAESGDGSFNTIHPKLGADKKTTRADKKTAPKKVVTKKRAARSTVSREKPIKKSLSSAKATHPADMPQASPSNANQSAFISLPTGKRYVVRFRTGTTIAQTYIISHGETGEYGFIDPHGEFVSLMHLEGPILAQSRFEGGFPALGLLGAFLGGPLGLLGASILSIRKQSIFKAKQIASTDKYISLDHASLSFLQHEISLKGVSHD